MQMRELVLPVILLHILSFRPTSLLILMITLLYFFGYIVVILPLYHKHCFVLYIDNEQEKKDVRVKASEISC